VQVVKVLVVVGVHLQLVVASVFVLRPVHQEQQNSHFVVTMLMLKLVLTALMLAVRPIVLVQILVEMLDLGNAQITKAQV